MKTYNHTAVDDGKRIARAIGISQPIYVIDRNHAGRWMSNAEDRTANRCSEGCIAFTSATLDLEFRDNLLRDEWQGRGICIVFAKSMGRMSDSQIKATMLHEISHHTDGQSHCPEAGHNAVWLNAVVSLWWKAAEAGYEVPFAEVADLERYGFGRAVFQRALQHAQGRRAATEPVVKTPSKPRSHRWTGFMGGQLVQVVDGVTTII